MKTSELTGPTLDWAVAKCEGGQDFLFDGIVWGFTLNGGTKVLAGNPWAESMRYAPSTNWAQGGPIIEREWLDITPWPNESREDMHWHCRQHDTANDCAQYGPTPLIAAMRCYVASKLGDTVEIPEELEL